MASTPLSICDYAVAFIDLLGQKAEMPGRYLPPNRDEAIALVKESVGKIIGMQKLFERFYHGFTAPSAHDIYSRLPEGVKREAPDLAPGELKWQHFSDGFVIYAPLGNGLVSSPSNSIFGMLLATGVLCCSGLAAHSPIRAGLDVGWGVEYRPNELYGAALACGYHLESQVAQWPRVVVGEGLMEYLNHYASPTGADIGARFRNLMAKQCMGLIAPDIDGQMVVDYLGKNFAEAVGGGFDKRLVGDARLFVEAQFGHWRSAGDLKLETRYAQLKRYFDDRCDVPTRAR